MYIVEGAGVHRLAIDGVCYLANSFADFLAPEIAATVFAFLMVSGLAQVFLCLWLLVMGVNDQRWKEQASAAAEWRSQRAMEGRQGD